MNNNDGGLSFKADLDNMDFKAKIKETENAIRGLSSSTVKETSTMDSAFSKLSAIAGGVFAFAGAKQFVTDIIQVRGEFQQLEIAFTTMLRSKERADKLMAEAIELASTTPFTLQDVASGAKQLLAYGTAAEDVTKSIRMIGDVASGVGAPLNDLIYLYGTLRASGRATTIDIRQFAGRGIPIYEELSKVVGKSGQELKDWIEQGKVGFAEVEKAFKNMTGEGGMFFNLMEEQSKSVTGRISNLQDAWSRMLNEIGQSNEGVIYGAVAGLNKLVENYKEIGSVVASLVTIYGSYKAATMAIVAVERVRQAMLLQTALAGKALSTWEALHAVLLSRLSKAQAVLNKTMLANPYVAVGAALAGIVTYLVLTREKTEDLTEAQKEFKSEAEDVAAKSKVLFDSLKRSSQGTQERKKAIEAVNAEYGQYLQNLLTESSTLQEIERAERLANVAMIERLANEGKTKDLVEIAKKQRDILLQVANAGVDAKEFLDYVTKKDITQFDRKTGKAIGGTFKSWGSQVDALVTNYTELINSEEKVNKKYNELTRALIGTPISIGDKPEKELTSIGDKIQEINSQISDLEAKKNALPEFDTTGVSNYNRKIDVLKNKLSILKGENRGELSPMGSIKYWEDVKSKAEAALRSLAPDDKDLRQKTEKYVGEIEQAQRQIDALEFDLKPFDDQLDYRRQQYDQYFKWVQHYGKETADKQFTDLLGMGADYAAFLERQQKSLQSIQNRTPQQNDQLLKVTVEIEKLQSPEAQLEAFTQKIENTRKEAQNLTEFLKVLSSEQQALITDFSPAALAKQNEVENQIKDTQSTIQKQYDNMLLSLQAFYNKYEAIKRDSSRKLAEISTNVDTGVITPEQGQIEIDVVYTGQAQAIEQLSRDVNLRIFEFQKFVGQIDQIAKAQLSGFVAQVNDIINIPELDSIRTQVLDQITKARELQNIDTAAGAEAFKQTVLSMTDDMVAAGGQAAELARKIQTSIAAIERVKTASLIRVDYEVNTNEAIDQVNRIATAVQQVSGINIEFDFVQSGADVEQIKAKVAELQKILSGSFGIDISLEGNLTDQIEAIKAGINTTLGVSIDTPKTAEDVKNLITVVQSVLNQGVVLPVETTQGVDVNELLSKYQGYVDKRKTIEISYNNDLRAISSALQNETDVSRRMQLQRAISERKKAYQAELAELDQSLGNYEQYYDTIQKLGAKVLSERIKQLKAEAEIVKNTFGSESDEYKAYVNAINQANKALSSSAFEKLAGYTQLAAVAASNFSDSLAESLENASALAGSMSSVMESLSSGDPLRILGSALQLNKGISDTINKYVDDDNLKKLLAWSYGGPLGLMNIFSSNKKEREAERKHATEMIVNAMQFNAAMRERYFLNQQINLATIQGINIQIQSLQSALLSAQQDYDSTYNILKSKIGGTFEDMQNMFNAGDLNDNESALFQQLVRLRDEIEGLGGDIEGAKQKINELFTGTTVDGLASGIVNAFKEGKTSLFDFAQSFEDVMRNAMFSILQAKVLTPLLEGYYDELSLSIQAMLNYGNYRTGRGGTNPRGGANQFSPEQILENAKLEWEKINNSALNYVNYLEQIAGVDITGAAVESMQGAIKGITEESASIIAGQFNAMRIIQADHLGVARNMFRELAAINYNTYMAMQLLKSLDRKIRSSSDVSRAYGDTP